MSNPADLDLTVLDDLVAHKPEALRKYTLIFISSIEDVLARIDAALDGDDLAVLAAMGHRAKSTASSIGAHAFSRQCLLLETSAKAADSVVARAVALQLRPVFEDIQQKLMAHAGV